MDPVEDQNTDPQGPIRVLSIQPVNRPSQAGPFYKEVDLPQRFEGDRIDPFYGDKLGAAFRANFTPFESTELVGSI